MIITIVFCEEDVRLNEIIKLLRSINKKIDFEFVLRNISDNTVLIKQYHNELPFVQIGPYKLRRPFTEQELFIAIGASQDRNYHLEQLSSDTSIANPHMKNTARILNKVATWLSKHYMAVINIILALYVGIPFLAPVFMKIGFDIPGRIIYSVYRPLCHQFAFRSWFLFGEQAFYPRELASINDAISFEQISGIQNFDINQIEDRNYAQEYIGNESVGYKIALCERDIAIYGSMLAFGIYFSTTGKKLQPVSWLVWLFIGVIPIGIDGLSQMGEIVSGVATWLPLRESTPLLRTITGSLFGICTAWYLFPMITESMEDVEIIQFEKEILKPTVRFKEK